MRFLASVAVVCTLPVGPANAVCAVTPLANDIASADTVFVATLTRAAMSKRPEEMQDGNHYVVRYEFAVSIRFKGDPSIVTALTTDAWFDDPNDEVFWIHPERSGYIPGDNILVVADRGDAPVSSIGCTPSRPWDDEARKTVAEVLGHS